MLCCWSYCLMVPLYIGSKVFLENHPCTMNIVDLNAFFNEIHFVEV